MTIRNAAFQMDPMEGLNIAGDSSFALMLSAQERGIALWHYDVRSLAWEADGDDPAGGTLTAHAAPGHRAAASKAIISNSASGGGSIWRARVDVVMMRQDPPFDLGYISAAFLLDRLRGRDAGA